MNYLHHSLLKIQEYDLDIDIQEPFLLPKLPADFTLSKEVSLIKNEKGEIVEASMMKEGERYGELKRFFPNGTVRFAGFYRGDEMHGPQRFYYESGQIASESWYYKGTLQGKMRHYYPTGVLFGVKKFKDGQKEGAHLYFYPNKSLRLIEHYKKGQLHGVSRYFSKEGWVLRETHYSEGKREGGHLVYDQEARLIEEASFKADLPASTHRFFASNGQLLEETHYHDSDRFDKRIFREDGSLEYEGVYGDQMVYTEKRMDPDGRVTLRKGQWVNRQLVWE